MDGSLVAETAWVRELEESAVGRLFDASTLARARSYAHEGAVVSLSTSGDGSMVLGQVQGTRPRPYQVFLVRHEREGGDWVSTRCSCPIASGCKHAAALVLHLRAVVPTTPSEASWRSVLDPLLQREAQRADSAAVQAGTGQLALLFSHVHRPPTPWQRTGWSSVSLRATRAGKTGRWLKNQSWSQLRRDYPESGPHGDRAILRPDHRELLDELAEHRTVEAWGCSSATPQFDLEELGEDPWALLTRAAEAGAYLGPDDHQHLRIDLEPRELRVTVTRHDDGLHLQVDLADLDLDPETDDGPPVVLLGEPVHTMLARDAMGLLHLSPSRGDGHELAPLAGGAALVVPVEDEEDFLARYLPSLARAAAVSSPDRTVDLRWQTTPRLVAEVTSPEVGVLTVHWGVEYVLLDDEGRPSTEASTMAGTEASTMAGTEADTEASTGASTTAGTRASAKRPVHPLLPLGAPTAGATRRTVDEQELLARAELREALRTLPDTVWTTRADGEGWWQPPSDSRYRGADAVTLGEEVLPALQAHPFVRVETASELPRYREAEEDPLVQVAVEDAPAGTDGYRGSDWFDLDVSVSIDDEVVPLANLLAALVRGDEILIMPTGTYFTLDRPELQRLRELIEEGREIVDQPGDEVRISRYHVGWFDELVALGVVSSQSAAWTAQIERLRSLEIDPAPPVPEGVEAILRSYQADGYQWMSALWDAGLGGILADDMGLGKTLQVLTTLARAAERGDLDGPVLVVAPTSVVGTWVGEAERFTPQLRVRSRPRTSRKDGPLHAALDGGDIDLLITSYAVLRLDEEEYAAQPWRAVILDEAHTVKNHQSKTYKAVRRLTRPVTFAVTGTPVENSLMDLWSLLSLVAPGLHPLPDRFSADWRRPIEGGDHERLARLRAHIRPLMLRRTKEEVALDLPPKTVQVLPVVLGAAHRRIYDRHLQRERQRMLGLLEDPQGNRVAILAGLTRLRQLALDPRLVEEDSTATSAKIEALVEHLEEIRGEGHRALVFSQFTRFLALVRERLDAAGITSSYLDGSTTNRQQVVDGFRTGEDPVFLISLKAGGVGLTLTEADYVFVLDPWWNPAAETQAIDRAHRIGQDKPVMVYRLVSEGTIEDKVLALQDRKRDLVAQVVDDDPLTAGLTASDLAGLLEH